MYYSKSNSATVNVPRNYSGNTFRISDGDEPPVDINPNLEERDESRENAVRQAEAEEKMHDAPSFSLLTSILSGISIEDVLLLGLILVIHQENPNDSILIFLLILLLAK